MTKHPISRARAAAAICMSIFLLAGCGGGGGSGGSAPDEPSLSLAPVSIPPVPTAAPGRIEGIVYATPARPAGAGVLVQLVRSAARDTAISEATTDGSGQFSVALPAGEVAGTGLLLRADLGSGDTLRAFAVKGRTDITVGTETVVRELLQRLRTGALSWSDLQPGEVDAGQVLMTFHADALPWQGLGETQAHIAALRVQHAYRADWNWWLKGLPGAQATPVSSGDIARLVTRTGGILTGQPGSGDPARFHIQTSVNGATPAEWTMNAGMFCELPPFLAFDFAADQTCLHGDSDLGIDRSKTPLLNPVLLGDFIQVGPGGIKISPSLPFLNANLRQVAVQAGPFKLLEFPWQTGADVVLDSASVATPFPSSMRVRRTVMPTGRLQIGDEVVPAVQIVLDLDISASNAPDGSRMAAFVRLRTWLSPELGRVQVSYEVLTSADRAPVQRLDILARRSDLSEFRSGAREPSSAVTAAAPALAGIMSVEEFILPHERLAYVKSSRRLYLTTPEDSGRVVEFDPSTRATRSTAALGGRVQSLVAAADGSRVYAGVEGRASITEIRTADMTVVREIPLPIAADGFPYATAYASAVDPTDPRRVAVMAAPRNRPYLGGAVLIFQDGVREHSRAPRPHENEGFAYYQAAQLSWSSDGAHLLLWSSDAAWRLRTRVDPLQEEGLLRPFFGGIPVDLDVHPIGLTGSTWTAHSGQLAAHDLSSQRLLEAPSGLGVSLCRPMNDSQAFCLDSSLAFGGPNFLALGVADGEPMGIFVPEFPAVGCDFDGAPSVVAVDGPLVIGSSRCGESDLSTPTDRIVLMRLPGY